MLERLQDVHHSIPAVAITASGTTVALLNFLDTVVRIGAGAAAFVASCYAIAYYRRQLREKRIAEPRQL